LRVDNEAILKLLLKKKPNMEIRNKKNQRPIDVTTNKCIINILFQHISGKELTSAKSLFRINLTKRSRMKLLMPEPNKTLNTTDISLPIVIIRVNIVESI
jgi:hypothetical protein